MKKLAYYDLKVGMKLAKDLNVSSTETFLIKAGTIINQKILGKIIDLKMFDICIKDEAHENTFSQAEEVYTHVYHEILKVFKELQSGGVVNVDPVKKCVEDFVERLWANDQILNHLVLIKSIDNYTATHSINVCIYSLLLGHMLGWDKTKLVPLGIGSILHDVGKAYIPDTILCKPGKLTQEEFEIIKQHPSLGRETLEKNKDIHPHILQMVYEHHECLDGSGYPEGKKNREIMLESKIIAVADVYDAVTTERVYRRALLPYEGVEVLMGWGSVKHLDPALVKIFLENINIYPLGTLVELTNGSIGEVIEIPKCLPTRPNIKISSTGEIVSLTENTTIFIKKILFNHNERNLSD